ncbi:Y-family DNA polymerase [Pseudoxanthomonas dokdonensis]|uniref:DNA repair nucleotidyltransferase n=1 Tax=Pseudoxanthomonas dokdonensis TaxID=344882 RepID=A0A0R0CSZ2_9GAMM|nr:DNA polymerase Y family protein [Pseudoxanthomonas dokdonensis]KRG67960.1 DNA repair nucleotidyltransferase [Pseudoxanthomonas dokdonensis]
MLWACVLLPQLALDAVLRRLPDPQAPLALVTGAPQLRSLHAVNATAAQAGLRPGMRLTAAHALLPELRLVEHDPQAQAHWQRFLAAWAYRHSSLVSAQWPGCIVLEVRASFRLLGPWPRLQAQLREELTALGFSHRIGLAPTARAAQVLAGLRDGMALPHPGAMADWLDRVPVRRARLPDGAGERLQQMGICDLHALRGLPRDSLRRRFGLPLLEHLDRLYGQADDPLAYYTPPDHFDARVELGYEVENHMTLLFPLRRLIGDLCTCLSIRDGGVQRFLLRLEHEGAHTDVEVGLLAAERDPAMLFELTRNRLERVRISQPVLALRLLARELPSFVPASRDLFDQRAQQTLPWPQLRERLRARLGDASVYRVAPSGDPRPEHAWQRLQTDQQAIDDAPPRPARPCWLLPQPIPLRDPRPRIVHGPERLESGWWDGADARRDYYLLETSQGQRAWAFAAPGERSGWMLHGWFA